MRYVVALSLALAGCTAGLELSVDVRSDLRAGEEVDEAEVSWERAGVALGARVVSLEPGAAMLDGVRLLDLSGLSAGVYRVRVTLRRAGVDVGQRSVAFQLDGDLAVTLVLTRACADDGCEPAPCSAATDCVREHACLRAECVNGRCFAAPDDALCPGGRCDPASGCGPGIDAGPDPDAGGGIDAGANPDAGGACAPLDCASPACAGEPCDDADPCTHTDRCTAGACAGTAITCASADCVTRTCNGSSTCTETPAAEGSACTDDGSECTADVCRAGTCAHEPRADGFSLGGFRRCCGGAAVDTSTNRNHCGACGLACAGSFPCLIHTGQPTCDCTLNTQCQGGVGWLCSTTYDLVCACTGDEGCPGTSRCIDRPGPNYCAY